MPESDPQTLERRKRRFEDKPDRKTDRSPERRHSDRQRSPERKQQRQASPPRRKTRWGHEDDRANYPGLPTALPPGLTKDQLDSYVIHLRVEELGRKIRNGGFVPREKRSPSPEPEYDQEGKRSNTREMRYRNKLEDEKTALVEQGLRTIPGFRPPIDYKRSTKLQDKVYIPARDFPEINFIGLLIGPRGHTLKKMENDTGVKISIRGKGSVKDGKMRSDGSLAPGEEEDLHCLVMAEQEQNLKAAMRMINQIIETATSIPEGQNELKRTQLRELAALNGTLRDDEAQICSNCGSIGHRRWECTEASNFTTTLVCRICSGMGHLARDCLEKNNPEMLLASQQKEVVMESEYATLMAELGAKNAAASWIGETAQPWLINGGQAPAGSQAPAPWQQTSYGTNGVDPNQPAPPPPGSPKKSPKK